MNMAGAIQEVTEDNDGMELGDFIDSANGTSSCTTIRIVDTSAVNGGDDTLMRQ